MKKAYLKWLVPIIALYVMAGITCWIFRGIVEEEVQENEMHKISHIAEENLRSVDVIIQTVVDYNNSTAVSFANMDFNEDQDKLVNVLRTLSKNESVFGSIVVDANGVGVNEKGEKINISNELFFAEIIESFHNGGSGMVQIREDGYFSAGSVVVVNYINFDGKTKGYLITDSRVEDIQERILKGLPKLEVTALVNLEGFIYAGNFDGDNLWEDGSDLLPKDTIKMYISQKKYYMSQIEGYGNLIVVPSGQIAGGVVIVATDDDMSDIMKVYMMNYYNLVIALLVIVTIYILANLGIFMFGSFIRKIRAAKESERIKTDSITGLYNEFGFTGELSGYTRYAGDRNGILFAISIDCDNSTDRINILKDVAEELKRTYRITDILGRGEEGEFLVFLKGFEGEKDIRKQTDELQMFLYDLKSGLIDKGKKAKIAASRAIYPQNGGNAEELLVKVREALEKSKIDGRGNISFCE
jgi:GGDEF domain-containing protein